MAGDLLTESPTRPFYRRESIRAVGLLISYDGRVPAVKLRDMARRHGAVGRLTRSDGRANGSAASAAVAKAMRPLVRDGLVRRDGEDFVAANLADLADWLAEALATIEERRADGA